MRGTQAQGHSRRSGPFLLIALVLILTACGDGSEQGDAGPPAASVPGDTGTTGSDIETSVTATEDATPAETIKIAAPLALTGAHAAFDVAYLKGLEFSIDYINDKGGIDALGGAKLELLVGDSESDAQRVPALLRRMVDDGAVVTVGPATSAPSLAAKPVVIELGLPFVSGPPAEDTLTDADSAGTIFRLIQPLGAWGNAGMEFLKSEVAAGNVDISTVGIVTVDLPPGPSLHDELKQRAEEFGWDVVVESKYDLFETRDFGPIVQNLRQADPDIVVGLNYPGDAVLFAQAMALQDWRPSAGFLWTAGGQYLNSFRETLGTDTERWLNASYMSPDTTCDELTSFAADYENEVGEPLTGIAGTAPAVVQVIVDALNRAGTTESTTLRTALGETDLGFCEGIYSLPGRVDFDEIGNNAGFTPAIVQHEGALSQTAVWPSEYATRTTIWPAR